MNKIINNQGTRIVQKLITFLLLLAFVCLLPGCSSNLHGVIRKADKRRYVMILLDESKSFEDLFADSCRFSAQIVMNLHPGDILSLQVVDNKAGEDSDVVIPPTTIENTIMGEKQKKTLAEKILNLKRRDGADEKRGTDIIGALESSAVIMNDRKKRNGGNSGKETEFQVVLFSDMRPDCFSMKDLQSFSFPDKTKGYCYYVRVMGNENKSKVSGAGDFKKLREQWSEVWTQINLNVESFSPVSSSNEDIARSFNLK